MNAEQNEGNAEFMGLRVMALVEAFLILAGLVVADHKMSRPMTALTNFLSRGTGQC